MNRSVFFGGIRPLMPGSRITQAQVHRIEAVLNGLEERSVPLNQQAYIFATAHHESDRWRAMTEYASGAAYEGRKDLGNTEKGDGVRYKGRSFLMITGRRNYADWSKRLGVDFLAQPYLVSDLKYAVPILIDGMLLGTFTGKKLGDYVSKAKSDFVGARRVINGTDRAALIAGYARIYLSALKTAQ